MTPKTAFALMAVMTAAGLMSCASNPSKESTIVGKVGTAQGQWRGKALVRHLGNGKSATLAMEIVAREPAQLRMDATGSFGVAVASIVLNGDEVRTLLPREKRFIVSTAGSGAFAQVVPVRIAPRDLLAVLFERPLPERDWKCDFDAKSGLATECANQNQAVNIKWLERNGGSRRLKIAAKEVEIELIIDEAKSKIELTPAVFTLTAPSGYKTSDRSG